VYINTILGTLETCLTLTVPKHQLRKYFFRTNKQITTKKMINHVQTIFVALPISITKTATTKTTTTTITATN
jgi:hypothetical protein